MKPILGAALCGMLMMSSATAAILNVDKSKSKIQVDGRSTGHGFTGTLKDYTIKATAITRKLEPTNLELSWKFSDLSTRNKKRDRNMMKWLGGGKPVGSFKFIKQWEKGGKKYAQGKLTIHKVTKVIAFPYTVKKEGKWVTADGTARLNYQDFNLPLIRALAVMTVKPELTVRFHLMGTLE